MSTRATPPARAPKPVAPTALAALLLVAAACQPRPPSPPTGDGARSSEPTTMRAPRARAATAPVRAAATPARPTPAPTTTAAARLPPAAALPLSLKLTVSKTSLTMAQRARLQVRFTAVNRGPGTIDPSLHTVRLLVNGQPSVAWMLAIGNGPRDQRWRALPAGESLQMGWALGKALFPAPGRYSLILQQGTLRSAPVTVTVAP